MSPIRDFRTVSPFSTDAVGISGRYIGRGIYWKIYCIENLYRIVLHSILSLQLPLPDWWLSATNTKINKTVEARRQDYLANPWHTSPGQHNVYYVGLSDLNEIARANADKLRVVVPDIDKFITQMEMVRLPRNIVAHMNFLNKTDRNRVDVAYEDFKSLIKVIQQKISLQIP